MGDLEMTKLCAEAMGAGAEVSHGVVAIYEKLPDGKLLQQIYNPLTNDEQCFALVKKFRLEISSIASILWGVGQEEPGQRGSTDENLNRAIVKCIANMHATPHE